MKSSVQHMCFDAFLHLPEARQKACVYHAVSVDESAQGRGIGAELYEGMHAKRMGLLADICCIAAGRGFAL